jgi:hypothetical protein
LSTALDAAADGKKKRRRKQPPEHQQTRILPSIARKGRGTREDDIEDMTDEELDDGQPTEFKATGAKDVTG